MHTQIKAHRRIKHHQTLQSGFRFSIPIEKLNIRPSFDSNQVSPLTLRASELPNQGQSPKFTCKIGQISFAAREKSKGSLVFKLKSLQDKLAEARKQFQQDAQKSQNSSNFQLFSFKQSSSNSDRRAEEKSMDKLEESTINLESRKLLFAIQSKQKIVWAQTFKGYYIGEIAKAIAGVNDRAFQHFALSLEVLRTAASISLPSFPSIKQPYPQSPSDFGKKTLVLDLDETLFHCSQARTHPDDLQIQLKLDGSRQKVYLSIRPYAISFLKRARKYFEIIGFTASEKTYAETILGEIDPQRELIKFCYSRQHCVRINNKVYAKDLSILGRDLSKVVLVDNSPFSYLYQLANGVPILPYYNGQDQELLSLQKYLMNLIKVQDVRKVNRQAFKFHRYVEFDDCQDLFRSLYAG